MKKKKKLYKETISLFKDDGMTPQEKNILKRLLLAARYRQKEPCRRFATYEKFCNRTKDIVNHFPINNNERKIARYLLKAGFYDETKRERLTLFGIHMKYFLHATNGEFERELELTQKYRIH